MEITKHCVICGEKYGKTLLTITKPDRFEKFIGIKSEGYLRKWVECSGCGVAANIHNYESLRLLKDLSSAYYKIDFSASSIADKYSAIMTLPSERSDNAQRVKRIHDFLDDFFRNYFRENLCSKLKVLDIGAGTGVFLSRFLESAFGSRFKWTGYAIDSDPIACKHLRSLNEFEVIEETFPNSAKLKNFNLCTLNKIVEHISDPVFFLKQVYKTLSKENGILYIEVPDKLTILYRPKTDNILGALHYYLYDQKSLIYLLDKAGFIPLQIGSLFEPSGKISVAAFASAPSVLKKLVAK